MAKKKTPAWDSKAMKRAIAKHDKKFAKKHGPNAKGGGWLSRLFGGGAR